eukprot:1593506-Rhodomonas_salina.1
MLGVVALLGVGGGLAAAAFELAAAAFASAAAAFTSVWRGRRPKDGWGPSGGGGIPPFTCACVRMRARTWVGEIEAK